MATQLGTDHGTGDRSAYPAPAVTGRSWTVAATNDRLLGERLDELMNDLASSDGRLSAVCIARLARLISALSELRDSHAIDAKGRCRRCRGGRVWPRRQACSVYVVLDDFIGHEPSPLLRAPDDRRPAPRVSADGPAGYGRPSAR